MNIVNFKVPANLTLDEVQKVVANAVKATGHLTCFSGFDMRFTEETHQNYTVDPETLEARKVGT